MAMRHVVALGTPRLATVSLFLLALAVPRMASSQTPIACGQTLSGNIAAPGQQNTYTFGANAGEAVIITTVATSRTLGAHAELYGPTGSFVAGTNYPGYNNTLGNVVLPATGTYTIIVRDNGLTSTGAYNVHLRFTTPGRCGTAITCGQTLSGTVTATTQSDSYTFSANAGEAVIITTVVTSGLLGAHAELYGPTGS